MKKREESLHLALATWIKNKYPDAIFRTDAAAGMKMTLGQAVRHKAIQGGRKSYPDLFIAEARGGYCGLFIELKAEHETIVLKTGEISSREHIQNQFETLNQLYMRGYLSSFALGLENAKRLVDEYMRKEKNKGLELPAGTEDSPLELAGVYAK